MQRGAPRHEPVHSAIARTPDPSEGSLDPAPRTHTYQVGASTVVELHGEIDIAGLELVGHQLDAVTSQATPVIIVDLTPTGFFDCSGLTMLCRAHRRAEERAGTLRLVCDNALTLRMLRTGGLLGVLRPVPTLAQALADAERSGERAAGRHGGSGPEVGDRLERGPDSTE